jgi:UDP-N-acetylglucosamine 2-epimerase
MDEYTDAEGGFYFGVEFSDSRHKGTMCVQIGGNPDGTTIQLPGVQYYDNLPRPQFLGLLKNCQRFITNSSCAIYEAPHFLKPEQIIMVGDRNKNRPRGPFQTGASDRIVSILKEYLEHD